MKIFLAGASGVIGRSLVPRLTGAGHDVTGMTGDAATTGLVRSLGARPVVVDVFDRDRLAEVIRAGHPDAVIDQLTSLRNGDYPATNRLRTEGTRNLVDAALAAGVQTVVAQSYCIYAPGPGLADETDPLDVNSPAFGAAAEALVALEATVSEAPHGVLLRYGTLYGPGTGYASDGAIAAQVRQRRAACHRGCDVVPARGGRRRRRGPGTGMASRPGEHRRQRTCARTGLAARLRRRHRGGRSPQKTAGYRQRAARRDKFQGTKGLRMGTHPSQLA